MRSTAVQVVCTSDMYKRPAPLTLLLFTDRGSHAKEQIRDIRRCLAQLIGQLPASLLAEPGHAPPAADTSPEVDALGVCASPYVAFEVFDVSQQAVLVEHFKLVATPALVKLASQTDQVLAGSDIVTQIEYWWPRWQEELESQIATQDSGGLLESAAELSIASPAANLAALERNLSAESDDDRLSAREGDPGAAELARLPLQRSATNPVEQSVDLMRLADEVFQLKQSRAQLEAQLDFKDRIIAMMAHDLRNPLTAASIAVETLELGFDPNSDRASQMRPELMLQLLKNAKTQIRTIDRMIADILQMAKGTAIALRIQPQPLDFAPLCQEVLAAVDPKREAKSQTIAVDIPNDLPLMYADAEQVRRLVTNLIDNAIKYTPEQGQIKITALHRTTQKVQVDIRDTGPGIPKSNQKHIFEERFRLQRDEAKDGYGLGLALCKRIVRAHFGRLWVDSTPGEGSVFHFTLPVYPARRARLAEPV